MLLFSSFHLAFCHFQLHHDDLLNVLVLLCLQTLYFHLVRQLHFFQFFLQVRHVSFQHVNLSFFLSDGVVVFFEVLFLLVLHIGLETGERWHCDEGAFFSFPFKRVVDHFDLSVFLFVLFFELVDFVLEAFIVFFQLLVGFVGFLEFLVERGELLFEGGDFECEFFGLLFESGDLGEMGFLFIDELGFVFFLGSEFEVDILDGLIEEFGDFIFVGELIEVFGFEIFDLLGEGLFEFLLLFEVIFEVRVLIGEGFDGGFGDLMFFF